MRILLTNDDGIDSPGLWKLAEAMSEIGRVLVVAPRAYRVERLAREQGLSAGEAGHRLDEEDAERRHFIGHHFGVDPDTSTQYDLVVNTGTLGLEAASALVTDALHSKVGSSLESLRPRA